MEPPLSKDRDPASSVTVELAASPTSLCSSDNTKAMQGFNDECETLDCKYCANTFQSNSDRIKHERGHRRERSQSYVCNICAKSFMKSYLLKRHKKTHYGVEEKSSRCFKCDICSKEFMSGSQLNGHKKNIHFVNEAVSQYKSTLQSCSNELPSCNSKHYKDFDLGEQPSGKYKSSIVFTESNQSKSHLCNLCSKTFSTNWSLKRHNNLFHSGSDSVFHKDEENPSKQHEEKPSKQHEEIPSNQHEEKPSKQHEEKPSKQHEENPSNQHEEKPSKQHEERPSKQHEEKTSKQHEENPSFKELTRSRKPKPPFQEKPQYKCDVCLKDFSRNAHLKRHKNQVHGQIPKRRRLKLKKNCDICLKEFSSSWHLKRHKQNIHFARKQFQCQFCSQMCSTLFSLNRHELRHEDKDTKDHSDVNPTEVPGEEVALTAVKQFACQHCPARFNHKRKLLWHETRHSDEKSCTRSLYKKSFSTESARTIKERLHNDINPYHCQKCNKLFTGKIGFNQHMAEHSQYVFTCDLCGKGFETLPELQNHKVLIHTADDARHQSDLSDGTENLDNDYKSYQCNKPCTDKEDLHQHIAKSHSETYQHTKLQKAVPLPQHLTRNEASSRNSTKDPAKPSMKERVYRCNDCKDSFDNILMLGVHDCHKESVFNCGDCLVRFEDMASLKEHKENHLKENHQVTSLENLDKPTLIQNDDEVVIQESDLKRQEVLPINAASYKGGSCSKSFPVVAEQLKHKKDQHQYSDSKAGEENQPQKESTSLTCKHCPLTFNTELSLNIHKDSHQNPENILKNDPCECKLCEECLDNFKECVNHENMHVLDNKKEAKTDGCACTCGYCGLAFGSKISLKIHMESHKESVNNNEGEDANSYRCNHCQKSFYNPLDCWKQTHPSDNVKDESGENQTTAEKNCSKSLASCKELRIKSSEDSKLSEDIDMHSSKDTDSQSSLTGVNKRCVTPRKKTRHHLARNSRKNWKEGSFTKLLSAVTPKKASLEFQVLSSASMTKTRTGRTIVQPARFKDHLVMSSWGESEESDLNGDSVGSDSDSNSSVMIVSQTELEASNTGERKLTLQETKTKSVTRRKRKINEVLDISKRIPIKSEESDLNGDSVGSDSDSNSSVIIVSQTELEASNTGERKLTLQETKTKSVTRSQRKINKVLDSNSSGMIVNQTELEASNTGERELTLQETKPKSVTRRKRKINEVLDISKRIPIESGKNNLSDSKNISNKKQDPSQCIETETVLADQGKKHSIQNTDAPLYKCEHCPQTYSMKGYLDRHYIAHKRNGPFRCKQCTASFNTMYHLTGHTRVHSGKFLKCAYCPKTSLWADGIKRHQLQHVKTKSMKQLECHRCQKMFTLETRLSNHRCVYKRFSCRYCKKRFASVYYHKLHENSHIGPKRFKCRFCAKMFTYNHHLTRHLRIHTKEKLYQCKKCGERFAYSRSLKSHILHNHEGIQFICRSCAIGFSSKAELQSHNQELHNFKKS